MESIITTLFTHNWAKIHQHDRYRGSSHAHSLEVPTNLIFGDLEATIGDPQELAVCRSVYKGLRELSKERGEGIFINVL